jgi:hypothetical protein
MLKIKKSNHILHLSLTPPSLSLWLTDWLTGERDICPWADLMRKLTARPHFLLCIRKKKVRACSKRSSSSQSVSQSACVMIILIFIQYEVVIYSDDNQIHDVPSRHEVSAFLLQNFLKKNQIQYFFSSPVAGCTQTLHLIIKSGDCSTSVLLPLARVSFFN